MYACSDMFSEFGKMILKIEFQKMADLNIFGVIWQSCNISVFYFEVKIWVLLNCITY